MFRKIRRILAVVLLVISISLIVWVCLPNKRQSEALTISPVAMQQLAAGQAKPASTASRQVILDWPVSMRIGEQEQITLSFLPVNMDQNPTGPPDGYSDIYQIYNLMAEGKYEVAGLSVSPVNPTRESMLPGQPLEFKWQISSQEAGTYAGEVWLSLRYLPLDGSPAVQAPIFVRNIKIQSVGLWGMGESTAVLLGGVGIVMSAILIYDDLMQASRKIIRRITVREVHTETK